jgi:catechol 1,2-dioxygenase
VVVRNATELTRAVLAEMTRAQDPRTAEILQAVVRHLHGLVTELRLSESELQQAIGWIARLGQATHASHNEVALASGSLGVSALVCLINNGDGGKVETTANLMGPFWRADSPPTPQGGSIVRSPTSGLPVFVEAQVIDAAGLPVSDAEVDVWHSSSEGFYENQDPGQADMNLRGKFVTDAQGRVRFRTIKPSGYPIPVHGPVGDLIKTLGRHNMRPAHIHFMICKPGYKTQFSQVYSSDDPHLDTDVQFGVTEKLIGRYELHQDKPAPDPNVQGPWYSLHYRFVIEPGESRLPKPPITGKATGERPTLEVLHRR